ncbi:hypothetical protein [Pedobacter sp. Hv1]|uniref:hypothetical protein n=1 Tax=Pedobacter sp. Hv1 TaxID=1740090 RepID=UPI0006E6D238|nr:hypothetical protein [Pedobacter sp. Hv1]KQC01347.1 hypothetical protein AQF98_06435 [Pedobacter sp. Hv1]
MKRGVIALMLLVFATVTELNAQSKAIYFLLEKGQEKGFRFNHVKCADGNYKAELFNVFFGADTNMITLFTALPDMGYRVPKWQEIKLDTIKHKLITPDTLYKQYYTAIDRFAQSFYMKGIDRETEASKFKREDIKPIIKIEGKYYTPSSPTLMEYFGLQKIDPSKSEWYIFNVFPNQSQIFEINIEIPVFSLKKFEEEYQKRFNHPSFNSGSGPDYYNWHYAYNQPILLRNNSIMINGETAYKFWTLASWMIDGKNNERGIDRFAYIPGTGIVSGAFTYHFRYSNKGQINTAPEDLLLANYLADIQLMPYEIDGKPVKK